MAIYLVLAVFIFVAVSLCMGKIPAGLTCFIAVVFLWLVGILDLKQTFENFVSGSIVTMVSMMVLSGGLLKTNILKHIVNLVGKAKGSGLHVLLLVSMLVPLLLAQFTGSTTALITVVPLLLALANAMNVPHTSLILPASVGASLGMGLFPIGLGASLFLLKNQVMLNCGTDAQYGFWDLCVARLPGTIATLAFILFFGYKFLPKREVELEASQKGELKETTLSPFKEKLSYAIFILTMAGMIINPILPFTLYQVAVVGAILMVVTGILTEREAFASVNWPTIFMIASMLGVVTGLVNSGVGDLIASRLGFLSDGNMSLMGIVAVCFIICVLLTQVMDNNTIIQVFTPIVVLACMKGNASPLAACAAIELSAVTSIMTPMASPATAMAYSMGGYTMKEMLKFCTPLIIVQTVVSIIWIPIWLG